MGLSAIWVFVYVYEDATGLSAQTFGTQCQSSRLPVMYTQTHVYIHITYIHARANIHHPTIKLATPSACPFADISAAIFGTSAHSLSLRRPVIRAKANIAISV